MEVLKVVLGFITVSVGGKFNGNSVKRLKESLMPAKILLSVQYFNKKDKPNSNAEGRVQELYKILF